MSPSPHDSDQFLMRSLTEENLSQTQIMYSMIATAVPKKAKSSSQLPLPSNTKDLEGDGDVAVDRRHASSSCSADIMEGRSPQHPPESASRSCPSLGQRQSAAPTLTSKTKKATKQAAQEQSTREQAPEQRQQQRPQPRNDIGPFPRTTRATRRNRILRSRASRSKKENVVEPTGLVTHEDRWAAMSDFAGSHRQDQHVLDLSNRALPPQALRYGVPPQAAQNVKVLRYDGNAVGRNDLPEFLDTVSRMFPNLESLSLTRNPCSVPLGEHSSSSGSSFEDDDSEDDHFKGEVWWNKRRNELKLAIKAAEQESIRMQRLYILWRLPDLKVVDGVEVTEAERELARPKTPSGRRVNREEWLTRAMSAIARGDSVESERSIGTQSPVKNGKTSAGARSTSNVTLVDEGDAVEVSLCGLITLKSMERDPCSPKRGKRRNNNRARASINNSQTRRERFLNHSGQPEVIEEASLTPPRPDRTQSAPSFSPTRGPVNCGRQQWATKGNDARCHQVSLLDSDPLIADEDVTFPNLDKDGDLASKDTDKNCENALKGGHNNPPHLAPRVAVQSKFTKPPKDESTPPTHKLPSLDVSSPPSDDRCKSKVPPGPPRGSRPPPSPSSTLRQFPQQQTRKSKMKSKSSRRRRRKSIVPERSMVDLDDDDEDDSDEDSDDDSAIVKLSESGSSLNDNGATTGMSAPVKDKQPLSTIDGLHASVANAPRCGVAAQCCC